MPTPPPRKRFPLLTVRWHLSTAIVMMFVAGAILGANLRPTSVVPPDSEAQLKSDPPITIECYCSYGWPCLVWDAPEFIDVDQEYGHYRANWNIKMVVIDVLAALAILFAVWFLCEYLIRRAAQKGA